MPLRPRALGIALLVAASMTVLPTASASAAAGLGLSARSATATQVGEDVKTTVTVRNRTRRTIRSVVLRVSPGSGVASARRTIRVASKLRPRRAKRVTVTVRATRELRGPVRVRLSAKGRGVRSASGSFTLTLAAPKPGLSLSGRAFSHKYTVYDPSTFSYSTYYEWLWFVNDQFVHRDTPTDSTRPTCTAVTVTEVSGSGCLAYALDPASGTVTITGDPSGPRTGRLDGNRLVLAASGDFGEAEYDEIPNP
ncbi:hypothetical protein [Patulibacter defluvii]|uniref:hypothetical protein n=1 Tax=Patulibacter defluvii TaxID=3095358 RepID=UPI002A74D10C|nr:hypothetical protein [Patulibacter sp. DM4]